jgi:hypothetical protein
MTAQNRTTLKGYFERGDRPTQAQFSDLIDSFPLIGGDTMTGPLVLPGDPTLPLQAATKSYVDNAAPSVSNYVSTTIFPSANEADFKAAVNLEVGIDFQAPITSIAASLSGNVSLNNTGVYFDGPTIAQGTSGTWFVSGKVTLTDSAGGAAFLIKLWDGTTVIDSAQVSTAVINGFVSCSLSGIATSPAGNLRISVQDITSTSGTILANQSSNAKDSTITAMRIG